MTPIQRSQSLPNLNTAYPEPLTLPVESVFLTLSRHFDPRTDLFWYEEVAGNFDRLGMCEEVYSANVGRT